jgi:hypothetical protein
MDKKKTVVLVWHNCMECFIKGIQNFLDWYIKSILKNGGDIIIINIVGENVGIEDIRKVMGEVDIIVSSCDSFPPTNNWRLLKGILEEKKWFVVHKSCEFDPREDFSNTETYKWLKHIHDSNKTISFIPESKILELNKKVNELKNKPRLDS